MPDKPVTLNNTPLVALWVLDRLDILRDLYQKVLIPQAVQEEFLATERILRESALDAAPWIQSVSLADPQRGRCYARRLGFPLTGTLGVLLPAKEKGLIPALAPLLQALLNAGLYLSPALVAEAMTLAGET